MSNGTFKYEDCLLKHYVRTEAWLPLCVRRKRALRQGKTRASRERQLRYFTFCAIGAVDVLMLDVERVIHTDGSGRFSTVCFFDVDQDYVNETQPGHQYT